MSSQTLKEVAEFGVQDEYRDFLVYTQLSTKVKGDFSELLSELAAMEKRHMEFWAKYAGQPETKPSRLGIMLISFFRVVFGMTFVTRYLDRHEAKVIEKYKSVAGLIPAEDKNAFDAIIADEELHERELGHKVESSSVQYISFVVLGLADALVEITGIHAGSLGIYDSTRIAGLAGVIAGAAASLAMSSAAFAQAKQGFQGSASRSAVYTGVSYFVTAIILATPYFLTKSMIAAISVSLTLAVIILGLTTFYSSVISNKRFLREFGDIAVFMFGVTVILFVAGYVIRVATGISITT